MTYCISDIHGCYDEYLRLLEKIEFSEADTLYILGDVVDRGYAIMDCLNHAMQAKNIYCLKGNHEQQMLEYYDGAGNNWPRLGGGNTVSQAAVHFDDGQWRAIVSKIRSWPLYKVIKINGKRFFLSHAGIDPQKTLREQTPDDLTWGRQSFYRAIGMKGHICVFGHTPTPVIRDYDDNCAVWFDEKHRDKVCIDCACVYGGALAALRLEDGKVFYAESLRKRSRKGRAMAFRVKGGGSVPLEPTEP